MWVLYQHETQFVPEEHKANKNAKNIHV